MQEVKKNLPRHLFLFTAFASGWAFIYGNALIFTIILFIIINVCADSRTFVRNLKQERFYLGIPVLFLVYLLIHTLTLLLFKDKEMKASYGIFETILLYFITIPVYILSIKPWITPVVLRRALYLFVSGVFLFNICIFFWLTKWDVFTAPFETLNMVYLGRFGGNKENLFGSGLMLEPQAMVLALASIIACFMLLIRKKVWIGGIALGLIIFLSFTVTKSSILAFVLSGITALIYFLRKISGRQKIYTLITVALVGTSTILFLPQGMVVRFQQTTDEIESIKEGKADGGSLAPRIAMWKDAWKHSNEFALFGVGVYYPATLKLWHDTSGDPLLVDRINIHNSFLEYWMRGGIPGLLMVISIFAFPIIRMKRLHQWSLLVLGSIIVIFLANNTCVLLVHVYSLGAIMFWLPVFYFYLTDFKTLENTQKRSPGTIG